MDKVPIKILGIVVTILGIAVQVVSDRLQNKRIDAVIAEKVAEAVKKD